MQMMDMLIFDSRWRGTAEQHGLSVPRIVLASPAAETLDETAMSPNEIAPNKCQAPRQRPTMRVHHVHWATFVRRPLATHDCMGVALGEIPYRREGNQVIEAALHHLADGARDECARQEDIVVLPEDEFAFCVC